MIAQAVHTLVSADTIIAVGTMLLLVVGIYFVSKSGGSEAVRILRDANEVLTVENKRLHEEVKSLAAQRTLEPIISEMVKQFQVMDERAQTRTEVHEGRAQARADKQVHVLEAIAARLDPLNNHMGE